MKRNDINELRTKTVDELKRMVVDFRNDAEKARTEAITGKLKNTNMIKNKKKDIARVLTFLHMKANVVIDQVEEKVEVAEKKVVVNPPAGGIKKVKEAKTRE
ncbi:MAG TPA: 50S ribosomal protein L29 [Patescibacteria group bacterium]|nr:50S ribosomal protein L29 [Patescibacteria group bacterium]